MEYSYIFDIGRVLVDFDFDRALERLVRFAPHEKDELGQRIFAMDADGGSLSEEYEKGRISSEEYFREIKKRADLDLDYERFAEIWADIFTENENVTGFLESIKDQPKIILSNTCSMHWDRLGGCGNIKNFFGADEIIKSYEVGLKKPDIRIFELAKKILPAGREIIYFDDMEENVKAAKEVGIRGIKYDCRYDDIDRLVEEHGVKPWLSGRQG